MSSPKRLLTHCLSKLLSVVALFTLFSSTQAFCQNLGYFPQVKALAPKDAILYPITPGTPESMRLDNIVLKILRSATGNAICAAFPNNYDVFTQNLFVNTQSNEARDAYSTCKNKFSEKKDNYKIFPKKYFFIFTYETNFLADGWTNPRNETYLFLNQSDYAKNDDRIIRTIAHELAISYDLKERIGAFGSLEISNLGIQVDENTTDLIAIIRSFPMKNVLSVLRAFDIEHRVLTDLGIPSPPLFGRLEKLSCTEKLSLAEKIASPLQTASAVEAYVNSMTDQRGPSIYLGTSTTFDEKAKRLNEIELSFADRSKHNACDYLTSSWPFKAGISFHGGPGPRVEGW